MVEVKVVDDPLEYNLLLKCTCFYAMKELFSRDFRVLCFPHQGKVITINQLAFCTPDFHSNIGSNVSFVGDIPQGYASVSVGMFKDSYLMATFPLPPPNASIISPPIHMIPSVISGSLGSYDP